MYLYSKKMKKMKNEIIKDLVNIITSSLKKLKTLQVYSKNEEIFSYFPSQT